MTISLEDQLNRKVVTSTKQAWSCDVDFTSTYQILIEELSHLVDDPRCSFVTLCNYGALLSDLGRHSEAESYIVRAVELGSNYSHPHHNLAVIYLNTGRLEEGVKIMRSSRNKQSHTDCIDSYFDPMAH